MVIVQKRNRDGARLLITCSWKSSPKANSRKHSSRLCFPSSILVYTSMRPFIPLLEPGASVPRVKHTPAPSSPGPTIQSRSHSGPPNSKDAGSSGTRMVSCDEGVAPPPDCLCRPRSGIYLDRKMRQVVRTSLPNIVACLWRQQ
jgi:hypothetical protein